MKENNIHDLFSEVADSFGSSIAIRRGEREITYGELERESNRLANLLISAGAAKGCVVAIVADNTIDVTTAILAILKAGCAFLPLDPAIPESRLRAMIAQAPPELFLVESRYLAELVRMATDGSSPMKIICLDRENGGGGNKGLTCILNLGEHENVERPVVNSGPDDMCYIYFTSGSTGKPKGIAGRLKAIAHFIRWEGKTLGLDRGTKGSNLTTPSFDAFLRDIFVPLSVGGLVCVPPERETVLDAAQLVKWINDERISLLHCVPSVFRSIVGQALTPAMFTCLRHVLLAGEPLLPSDVKKWVDVFGENVQLVNLYGPSETTMTKLFYFVKASDKLLGSIPIGKPMEGARALVLDGKWRACPPGTVGEIYIRTPYRALGYYNDSEQTQQSFVQNPFSDDPNDIIYKTGDLGRVTDDGNFEFIGRKDQQVKIRGVRIELREIENLLHEHRDVNDVAVVDRDDSSGNKYLCAYVVLGRETETGELRSYLSASLPDYMIPSAFVVMNALPRTISGKIDRRALPVPGSALTERPNYVAPRTPVEESLAAIWTQLLGIERVGIHDNFFEVGGHSLIATQLLSRVRDAFAVELPLRALFGSPTIAGLSLAITRDLVEQESDEELARILNEIKSLSDDQITRMLDEASQ